MSEARASSPTTTRLVPGERRQRGETGTSNLSRHRNRYPRIHLPSDRSSDGLKTRRGQEIIAWGFGRPHVATRSSLGAGRHQGSRFVRSTSAPAQDKEPSNHERHGGVQLLDRVSPGFHDPADGSGLLSALMACGRPWLGLNERNLRPRRAWPTILWPYLRKKLEATAEGRLRDYGHRPLRQKASNMVSRHGMAFVGPSKPTLAVSLLPWPRKPAHWGSTSRRGRRDFHSSELERSKDKRTLRSRLAA